ncbi:MAG: hypothetical protein HZA54_11930 [Planctomycetes bacterium]|nr:hypothetical protein [Planctomycetota bacterium]
MHVRAALCLLAALALLAGCEPAPALITLTSPTGTLHDRVTIPYTLKHPQSRPLGLLVEVSTDGGASFRPATRAPGGDGQSGLPSSPAGTPHTFIWDSRLDAGDVFLSGVRLRFVAYDPRPSAEARTAPLVLDNTHVVPTTGPIPYTNSGVPHVHPDHDSPVPVSGHPYYLENLEIGTPLADYGSHSGIKAAVQDDGPAHHNAFLNHAQYAAFHAAAGQAGQAFVWFDGPSGRALAPATSRAIAFKPWGWEETVADARLSAVGRAVTLATDAFLIAARVTNTSGTYLTLGPRFALFRELDGIHEGMHPLHLTPYESWSGALGGDGRLRVAWSRGLAPPLDQNYATMHRSIRASVAPAGFTVNYGIVPGTTPWQGTLRAPNVALAPGATAAWWWVIGCGENAAEADLRADAGVAALGASGGAAAAGAAADAAWSARAAEWGSFLSSVPAAHTAKPAWLRLREVAAAGLRMNLYAPRHEMAGTNITAGKVHFNLFWVWDTALSAIGVREWNPALAREVMREQLGAQGAGGILPYASDDQHRPVSPLIADLSLAPASGWALREILRATPTSALDPAWTAEVYARSKSYVAWWEANRRYHAPLFGFKNALETGWDDTPRYPRLRVGLLDVLGTSLGNLEGLAPTTDLQAVDLNVWLHEYELALADLADRLGLAGEATTWRAKASALAHAIDGLLWVPAKKAYLDRKVLAGGGAEPVTTLTPVMAWPLAMGICRDAARARALCADHLLNPREFFGAPGDATQPRYPVPSVAYNDPKYDFAQDGYYWRGQVWLIPSYMTLKALYRYGYESQAATLKARLLDMMAAADPGGIHEAYDAFTGEVGWGSGTGSGGVGEPSVFQLAFSCSFALEILLDRWQRERFLMPGERRVSGYVETLSLIATGRPFFRARGPGYEVPKSTLAAVGSAPLGADAPFTLRLEDPYGNLPSGPIAVAFPTLTHHQVQAVGPGGTVTIVTTSHPVTGIAFSGSVTGAGLAVSYYRVVPIAH